MSPASAPPRSMPGDPPGGPSVPRLALGMLRAHQWVKNLLVFVPLVGAHRLDLATTSRAAWAFLTFCLCASSAYIVNDLLDLESDRTSSSRSGRPLAAGHVTPRTGLAVSTLLLLAAFGLAMAQLPRAFLLLLGSYWIATLVYSLWLKRIPMLDVIILAGLYTARVLGGTYATDVPTSSWLFTFAIFLFLALALVKRTSELQQVRQRSGQEAKGRGYLEGDLEVLGRLGAASGYLAVLVLALYISSPDVTRLYAHHERLWLLCPLSLYWVGRVWLLAHRGLVHEDPVVFALRDPPSYLVGATALAIVYLAV
jgi:4-hydroxybenzoate polyprenyltransferase